MLNQNLNRRKSLNSRSGDQRSESFELVVTITSKQTKKSNSAAIVAKNKKKKQQQRECDDAFSRHYSRAFYFHFSLSVCSFSETKNLADRTLQI